MFSQFFFENCAFYEIMWKNFVERVRATDDNMTHAQSMQDT
jgi:hypothetical protein